MTTIDRFDPFERRITDAIDEIAAARRPDYLDSVLQLTVRSHQRPRWVSSERWLPLNRFKFAAAAVAVAIVGVVGLSLAGGKPAPSIGASTPPSAATSASLTPSKNPVQSPSSTPQIPAGSTVAVSGLVLSSGKTYSGGIFAPALTFLGHDGWQVFAIDSALLVVDVDTTRNAAHGQFTVMRVGDVLEPGGTVGGPAAALPADIVAWFRARPDLNLEAPTAIKVGGIDATLLRGSVRPKAIYPQPDGLEVACEAGLPICSADNIRSALTLWAGDGSGFEVVALHVQGQQILIALSAQGPGWATLQPQLESFLAGITFLAPAGG